DVYDPLLNPLYRDVLAHYGVVALPCRVRDPDRKGKVESGIAHTQKALRGLRFESLEEAQRWLDHWDERWADTRIHGTTKRQVAAMFADERPHLRPLPVEPFRYYAFGERVVHFDGFVEVAAAYYAPPPGWIGRVVNVQWDEQHVRLLDPKTNALLREHVVADRGRHRMRPDDRPSRTPPEVSALMVRAHGIGPAAGAIADAIYAEHKQLGVRRILGLCGLAKRHGAPVVERAAQVALDAGAHTYRAVKAYLARNADPPITLRQIDPLIRDLTEYRDLVCRITQGETP
ncbi:MAG TPA: IS21 family transposase, partial [Polyangiales bacterium]|nr:IS21 family transposase [Polyangiales bacterium]